MSEPEWRIPEGKFPTRNISGASSVVPIKLIPGTVPAFPVRAQPLPPPPPPLQVAGVCQLARPVASEVRTFPGPGLPPVIITCPATSSFAHGVEVPIPRYPDAVSLIYSGAVSSEFRLTKNLSAPSRFPLVLFAFAPWIIAKVRFGITPSFPRNAIHPH